MKSTNKLHALLFGSFLFVLAGSANAAVIATEYFNGYGSSELPTGSLNGGTGWSGSWSIGTADGTQIAYRPGTNISFSATGYDNSANLSGSTHGALGAETAPVLGASTTLRNFTTAPTTGTVWFSALIAMDGADRSILFMDGTTDFIGVIDGQIALRYNNTTVGTMGAYDITNTLGNATFTSGTGLLLGKAELNYSGTFDRLSFWFNPNVASGESGIGTALLSLDGADTFGVDGITSVSVLVSGDEGTGSAEFMDAIRVGTQFADVIPEPSTALLGSLGILLLLRRRR